MAKGKGGTFRLTRGVHSESGRTYKAGEIIHSASDLEHHNYNGPKRFERVTTVPIQQPEKGEEKDSEADDLEKMTLADLEDLAKEGGIELGMAKKKTEIIKIIRRAMVEA